MKLVTDKIVGDLIHTVRRRRSLRQYELAKGLRISPPYMAQVELGKKTIASWSRTRILMLEELLGLRRGSLLYMAASLRLEGLIESHEVTLSFLDEDAKRWTPQAVAQMAWDG